MPETNVEVKPGKDTTEYEVTKSSSVWGIVAMVLGFVITVGGSVTESLGQESKVAIAIGAIVSLAGLFLKTFTALGYIASRTKVKTQTDKPEGA